VDVDAVASEEEEEAEEGEISAWSGSVPAATVVLLSADNSAGKGA